MGKLKIRVTVEFELEEKGLLRPYHYSEHEYVQRALLGENAVGLDRVGRNLVLATGERTLYRYAATETGESPTVTWKTEVVR